MTRQRMAVLALAVSLAACTSSSPTTAPTSAGGQGGNGGGSSAPAAPSAAISSSAGGIVFSGVIKFTGGTPVQGSFTDSDTGSSETSCSGYATGGAPFQSGWIGPDPNGASVGGVAVTVSPHVVFKDFHGPGTYMTTSFLDIEVGSAKYASTSATIVINADSSGSLTFADAPGGSPGSGASESGTMTWTCAAG
jgi:hypothetical protein